MLIFGFAAPAANPPTVKGPLAQLGERYVRIVEVASSILARSTKFSQTIFHEILPRRRGAAAKAGAQSS